MQLNISGPLPIRETQSIENIPKWTKRFDGYSVIEASSLNSAWLETTGWTVLG
jgi:TusA-related sulfurtransferase